jgi:hypothetical protein
MNIEAQVESYLGSLPEPKQTESLAKSPPSHVRDSLTAKTTPEKSSPTPSSATADTK